VSRRSGGRHGGAFRGVALRGRAFRDVALRGGAFRGGAFRGVICQGMTCRLGGGRASSGSFSHVLLDRIFLSFNILGRLLNILCFGRAAHTVYSLGLGALSSLAQMTGHCCSFLHWCLVEM